MVIISGVPIFRIFTVCIVFLMVLETYQHKLVSAFSGSIKGDDLCIAVCRGHLDLIWINILLTIR